MTKINCADSDILAIDYTDCNLLALLATAEAKLTVVTAVTYINLFDFDVSPWIII